MIGKATKWPKINVKVATLYKLRGALNDGDLVAAQDLVSALLDQETQRHYKWCKDETYHRYMAGEFTRAEWLEMVLELESVIL